MTSVNAGWYPDPLGAPQQRFFDGAQWTDHYAPQMATSEIAPPQGSLEGIQPRAAWPEAATTVAIENKRNPLFFVLAVLSALPTAFFGFFYLFAGQSDFMGIGLIWCFIWTAVWWKMSDRYR